MGVTKLKERIIQKGSDLFQVKGFTQTSIQDIVETLDVTKGTFYYYFTSKEELLMEINLRYINDVLEKQVAIMGNHETDARTKIKEVMTMLIKNIDKQGANAKIFFRELNNLNEKHLKIMIGKRKEFYLNLQTIVENGIASGELRPDLRPDIVTFGILGVCNWSYHWFDPQGELTDVQVAHIFADMILNGLEVKNAELMLEE